MAIVGVFALELEEQVRMDDWIAEDRGDEVITAM